VAVAHAGVSGVIEEWPEAGDDVVGKARLSKLPIAGALQLHGSMEGGRIMGLRMVQFLGIVLIALALVPVGSHLMELPNKIDLAQKQYFTVQAIYLGWAIPASIVLIGGLAASLVLTIMLRGQRAPFWLALAAVLLVGATLVIFFVWTYPANQATSNWTTVPENWRALRVQWEYSHAMNAVLTFIALCAVTLSTLTERR
jgi:hypothetical protein